MGNEDGVVRVVPARRLPLQGAKNTRDLGGYPCAGGVTRWGRFLRSDNPGSLTPQDIEVLRRYGVTHAVDLRRQDECLRAPSLLEGAQGFTVHRVPLHQNLGSIDFEGDVPGSMAGLYITLLDDSGQPIAEVMMDMAQTDGGVLFHCAVGKDRTGVVAMLLLKLAGVCDADVVADYAATDIYMRDVFDAQASVFKQSEVPPHVLQSKPASMWRVLQHLRQRYGTAEDYLLGAGVPQSEINQLKAKLVEPAVF